MHRSILIVDDEDLVREYLMYVLRGQGYRCVGFSGCRAALDFLATGGREIAVIVSDIRVPGMSGIEFLANVRAITPNLPFILLSGIYDRPTAMEAYRSGSTDYLLKPVNERDLACMVRKHFGKPHGWNEAILRKGVRDFLAERCEAGGQGSGLRPMFEALGGRRFETLQHSQRVAAFSCLIGISHGLGGKDLQQLETGALLHDIGKVAVPQNVIDKRGHLSEEEWRVMKLHPEIGAGLLSDLPGYGWERDVVLCHHERFDGSGYPHGKGGTEIPTGARIFSVADALDAICSDRPYRSGSSLGVARGEISRGRMKQFDPEVVDSFLRLSDAVILAVQKRHAEPGQVGSGVPAITARSANSGAGDCLEAALERGNAVA